MADSPILIGGASVTVLTVTNAPGGLAGLQLLSQSGPAVTVEISGDLGFEALSLPYTFNVGDTIRLTRTDTTSAVSVLQASYPDADLTLSLSEGQAIGSQKPPPYDQTTTPASVQSLSLLYTGGSVALRGLAFPVPVAASNIEAIEVHDITNSTTLLVLDPQQISQQDASTIRFPALGLGYRTRLNVTFTAPVSLPTLLAPQLSAGTQVIGYDVDYAELTGIPLVLTLGLSRRVYGPLSPDALPISSNPADLSTEHTGHILAVPGQAPKLRFIHEGVTYALTLNAE